MSDLQDFFVGGFGALIDSQRYGDAYVNNPVPRTQDGASGTAQVTSYAQVLTSPIVIGGAILAAVLLVALIVKK